MRSNGPQECHQRVHTVPRVKSRTGCDYEDLSPDKKRQKRGKERRGRKKERERKKKRKHGGERRTRDSCASSKAAGR